MSAVQAVSHDQLWYEIPATARADMLVPARVYADAELWSQISRDRSLDQLMNVTTLRGIVRCAYGMPDMHEGYGFPVGGVAAMRATDGVISPGGVGYDINCGVRLLVSELEEAAVRPRLKELVHELSRSIPSGTGRGGRLSLSDAELDRVLGEGCRYLLERELATLDDLSGGRFILGVGVSNVSDRDEFRAVGKPFLPYNERYAMLGEYVEAMKAIWTQPTASFHGKYVNFDGLTIYPKPGRKPHIPVWAGCHQIPRDRDHPALRFTLDRADGWLGGLLRNPKDLKTYVQNLNDAARQEGKNLSNFDWCYQLRLSIGKDEEEAQRNAAWVIGEQPEMARYAGYMWKLQEANRASIEGATIGAPSQVLKTVEEAADAGATSLDLWFIYPRVDHLLTQLRLFAKEIIPSFS